ncbi:MAG TPA: hypothetical protein VH880_09940 [Anaeromyxobacteraceae bacterium]
MTARAPIACCALLLAAAASGADGDAVPQPVPVAEAVALSGGGSHALRKDGESTVAPGATFRLLAAVPLADARLALYDADEALVPAAESAEVGSTGTRLEVRPARRLRRGGRYALRLEGAAGRELHDVAGRPYRPVSFTVVVSAEPPAARRRRSR